MNNEDKIKKVFFSNPMEEFGLREISRKTKIAPISVKKYLDKMIAENIIKKRHQKITKYPIYMADFDSTNYKLKKKLFMLNQIYTSNAYQKIINKFPNVVILFGSTSKGEDTIESDIDIYIESKEFEISEKIFNRKISPLFSENFGKLSKELKNNILNGIILYGYLDVYGSDKDNPRSK